MHTHLLFIAVLLCSWIPLQQTDDIHWNYHGLGPDVWKDIVPACGGQSQSPINIMTACTVYQPLPAFNLSSNYGVTQNFSLANNGHGISATLTDGIQFPLSLNGGGLNGTFKFVNIHLHWGENYASGSEHEIDGQKYAGEIHVVHQNTETGQLAVLGFFMQSPRVALSRGIDPQLKRRKRDNSSTTNQATMNEWMNYFSIASGVKTNKTGSINMNLAALIGGNLNDFWRYSGSLTVPACTEGVIWSVFTVPIQFNDSFIATFRSNILDLSNRETQPLNGRIVYRNYLNRTGSRASADSCCAAIPETTTPAIGKTSAQSSAIFLLFLSLFISLII